MAIVTKTLILPDPLETITGFVFPLIRDNFPLDLWNELRADGQDLLIYSDEAKTQRLAIEINGFTKTPELAQVWVRLETYSTVDRSITIEGGDPARTQPAVGAAFGRNAVWAEHFYASHDGRIDSTGGTITATSVVDGVIGPLGTASADYDGAKTEKTITSQSEYTLFTNWRPRYSSDVTGVDIMRMLTGAGSPESSLLYDSSPAGFGWFNTPNLWGRTTRTKVDNTWEHLIASGSDINNIRKIYYNGVSESIDVPTLSPEGTGRTSLIFGENRAGWVARYDMAHTFMRSSAVSDGYASKYYQAVNDPANFAIEAPLSNTAPAVTATAPESIVRGGTVTATATGTDTENDVLTYLWRVVSGTATLSSTSTATVTYTMGDTPITLGVVVSDAEFTSSEVFVTTVPELVVQPVAIPNFTETAVQGIAVNSSGFYLFNSIYNGDTNEIVKVGFDGTVLLNNANPNLNLPTAGKTNDGFATESFLYGILSGSSNYLVSYNPTTLAYISHVTMPAEVVTPGGGCLGHTGNVFVVNWVRNDLSDPDTLRVIEMQLNGTFVQYHALDRQTQEMQGITFDGTFYYITSSDVNLTSNKVFKFDTSFNLQEVISINSTFTEMEGIDHYNGKLYVNDIQEAPFEFLDVGSNTLPVSTAPADQNLAAGEAFSVSFTLSDADNDAMTYTIQDVNGHGVALTDTRVGDVVTVTGTAPTAANSSIIRIGLTPSDTTGAGTQVTVDLNVAAEVDATLPVITLLGTSPVTVTQNTTYTDAGATALDNIDGDITADIVTVNPVNTAIPATYTVTYNVDDAAGNSAVQVTRTVIVEAADTTAPVITLNGSSTITINENSTYTELGATTDDGSTVVIGGDTVDTSTPGTYIITYNATDASSNAAVEVTRTVTVLAEGEVVALEVTLSGVVPGLYEVFARRVEDGAVYTNSGLTFTENTATGPLTLPITYSTVWIDR